MTNKNVYYLKYSLAIKSPISITPPERFPVVCTSYVSCAQFVPSLCDFYTLTLIIACLLKSNEVSAVIFIPLF